jgi:hypothetical protein
MEKTDNEDIIIPVCILLIAAQIQQYIIQRESFRKIVGPWILEVARYTLWDRTCSILYSKDHDTFYLWPIRDLGLRSGGYIINK